VACSEKTAKFTPLPSAVAPSGDDLPSQMPGLLTLRPPSISAFGATHVF